MQQLRLSGYARFPWKPMKTRHHTVKLHLLHEYQSTSTLYLSPTGRERVLHPGRERVCYTLGGTVCVTPEHVLPTQATMPTWVELQASAEGSTLGDTSRNSPLNPKVFGLLLEL